MAEDLPGVCGPRQTLAMRLAERNRQRELRAERLARLRPEAPNPAPNPAPDPAPDPADDAEAALEEFLRALTGDRARAPAPAPAPEPGAVLPFQRPAITAPSDLGRLPGVGPGLVWALERAGLRRLADLAALEPKELAERLGPLGRLVPAQTWIAAARAAPA
jgi:predicted flap endonuclease-1-like 5' DNA nuclease